METLIAYIARVKNRTDFAHSVDAFEPTRNQLEFRTCGTRRAGARSARSVGARGRNATERGMTKSLIRERFKTVRYSYNDLRTTRVVAG